MQRRYRKKQPVKSPVKQFKMNLQIKAPEVRFVDEEEGVSEIMPLKDALKKAQEMDLDLVEVSPKANPPVVKIIDYGSYKYEQEKKIKKQRALQKKTEVKGVRLTFRIKGADLDNRRAQALKFLEAGNNVKIELFLRGRERAHRDKAIEMLKKFSEDLGEDVTMVRPMDRQGARLSIEVTKKSQ